MTFKDPQFFAFIVLLPVILFWFKRKRSSSIRFSSITPFARISQIGSARRIQFYFDLARLVAFLLIIAALARPQQVSAEREFEASGIDIVLALDISGSMLAEDFKPANRISVAKEEAKRFIKGRHSDRIGLVVFAGKSYTQCPLTLDYHVLTRLIDDVQIGLIKDGTAIGLAIANAVNRLRDSDAKSRIIILLTDGDNNAGNIDPVTAAELAKSFGIRIYTIGIGTGGLVPFPIDDPIFGKRYVQAEVAIDERMLKRIADITGGLYFPARDAQMLSQVYEKIDKLEKSDFKVQEYQSFNELFDYFLWPGILILLLEIIIRNTFFLKVP
ncbi:MAG: aerotolerance regulator BatA [Candidatus Omnitrophica bacterium CG11_big_fil_rev_8_21_14_0_20_45_26]|uniref:Aerotolerance regulator BatA n=1 Tax=Candidatus Abzuiibacterium crystallinum TaxID=1974748 RepID=A0A2H0LS55_9BACT|nr:MAG: aerotolerance regulator BatA [Candidatus Omnitrophica bacterium CG11_big_fil_rev_8_21_14_0_20_45_26]PIW65009.1 MAG: aerotolerance regulator BatA [Candidatus Omnitrophica bacterium CG12_big_fil_rev_8_21_14_0_65_45_16]